MNAERSTDRDRPVGELSGILKRFKKKEVSAPDPISLGMIKSVYKHAIEYSTVAAGSTGLVMFGGLSILALGCFLSWDFYHRTLPHGIREPFDIISMGAVALFFYIGIYGGIKFIRLELHRPEGEPIIFDRKNRKVYRIYRESYAGFRGLLMAWPMKYAEHDWDLVDAEHQAALNATGSSAMRNHGLIFLVRKNKDDPEIVASFTLGGGLQMGEITLPAVWEHIRRFMEDGGPHLPREEILPEKIPRLSLLQCLARSGPFGKNFRIWLKNYTFLFFLYVILLPISFPVLTFIGICRWLSIRTAIPIIWPRHVEENVKI